MPFAEDDAHRQLAHLEQNVLDRWAPHTQRHRIAWRSGTTEVLELGVGPPLLLVHGGLGDAFHWAPILPALAASHRVLAVHRPGHGLADPFRYEGVDIPSHAVEFLGDVLDALDLGAVDIAANSMGGLWSATFAIAHPQRVRHLVLVGAPAGVKRHVPVTLLTMRWPLVGPVVHAFMRRATRESTRDFWRQICVAHPERLDDAMLDATAASQRANLPSWIGLCERLLDWRGLRPELLLEWERVEPPVRFVWGERDAFGPPEDGRGVCRRMANAHVVEVADAGHLPWLDAPDAVADAILDFVALPSRDEVRQAR